MIYDKRILNQHSQNIKSLWTWLEELGFKPSQYMFKDNEKLSHSFDHDGQFSPSTLSVIIKNLQDNPLMTREEFSYKIRIVSYRVYYKKWYCKACEFYFIGPTATGEMKKTFIEGFRRWHKNSKLNINIEIDILPVQQANTK